MGDSRLQHTLYLLYLFSSNNRPGYIQVVYAMKRVYYLIAHFVKNQKKSYFCPFFSPKMSNNLTFLTCPITWWPDKDMCVMDVWINKIIINMCILLVLTELIRTSKYHRMSLQGNTLCSQTKTVYSITLLWRETWSKMARKYHQMWVFSSFHLNGLLTRHQYNNTCKFNFY